MAAANLLIVSDLHFGEELLPGASVERRHAVELGAAAFREFLRYHTVRRRDGRIWRLVIAGDLFDFMSVVISATRDRPAKSADERRFGLGRGVQPGVERMRRICEARCSPSSAGSPPPATGSTSSSATMTSSCSPPTWSAS